MQELCSCDYPGEALATGQSPCSNFVRGNHILNNKQEFFNINYKSSQEEEMGRTFFVKKIRSSLKNKIKTKEFQISMKSYHS